MGPFLSQQIFGSDYYKTQLGTVLSPPNKQKVSLSCHGLSLWLLPEADLEPGAEQAFGGYVI